MSEPKWTPGPWKAMPPDSWGDMEITAPSRDGKIEISLLKTDYNGLIGVEQVANARLIAAAPDLYDSCDPDTLDAIADEIDCFEHSARTAGLRSLAKRQRAAQAKARGE